MAETFRGVPVDVVGYCKCQDRPAVSSVVEEFGYWDVCCKCGRPLENGFHFYNHYDGEDHDDDDWDIWR